MLIYSRTWKKGGAERVAALMSSELRKQGFAATEAYGLINGSNLLSTLYYFFKVKNGDILIAHQLYAGTLFAFWYLCLAWLIKKDIRLIIWVHNPPGLGMDRRLGLTVFLRLVIKLYKKFARSEIQFVCVSQYVKKNLQHYLLQRINAKVIYNPVVVFPSSTSQMADPAGNRIVLTWLGRFEFQKNPQRFLQLAINLKREMPGLECEMYGEGSLKQGLKASITDRNVGKWFKVYDFTDDLAGIFSRSDLVISTSRWEGFGLSCIEANIAKRPFLFPNELSIFFELKSVGAICFAYMDEDFCAVVQEVLPRRREFEYSAVKTTFDLESWGNRVSLEVG
jgi:glycosyltransferase involved in cell wall biosynthesis